MTSPPLSCFLFISNRGSQRSEFLGFQTVSKYELWCLLMLLSFTKDIRFWSQSWLILRPKLQIDLIDFLICRIMFSSAELIQYEKLHILHLLYRNFIAIFKLKFKDLCIYISFRPLVADPQNKWLFWIFFFCCYVYPSARSHSLSLSFAVMHWVDILNFD